MLKTVLVITDHRKPGVVFASAQKFHNSYANVWYPTDYTLVQIFLSSFGVSNPKEQDLVPGKDNLFEALTTGPLILVEVILTTALWLSVEEI